MKEEKAEFCDAEGKNAVGSLDFANPAGENVISAGQIKIPSMDHGFQHTKKKPPRRGSHGQPPMPAIRAGSRNWILFFLLFAVVFAVVLKHFSGIEKDFLLLEKVQPPWLAAALVAQLLTYVFTAGIYQLLLRAFHTGTRPRLTSLVKASVTGLFFDQTVPSAGVSGNAFFLRYLSGFGVPATAGLSLILAELLVYYAAIETLLLVLLFTSLSLVSLPHVFVSTLALGLLAYLFFTGMVVLAGRKNLLDRVSGRLKKIRFLRWLFAKMSNSGVVPQMAGQDTALLKHFQARKRLFATVYLLQLIKVAPDVFTIFALFSGIGVPVSFAVVLLCFICTQVVSLLPFLPGSLVLYESSMSFFLATLHVPLGSAIVVTLLFRLLSFWLPMPFGLFFYRRWLRGKEI